MGNTCCQYSLPIEVKLVEVGHIEWESGHHSLSFLLIIMIMKPKEKKKNYKTYKRWKVAKERKVNSYKQENLIQSYRERKTHTQTHIHS